MKKTNAIITLLLVFLGFTGCIDERVYYVAQTGTYIKTIRKNGDKHGYILFGNDSVMDLSKNVDYIKSSIYLSAIFVLNPNRPDDIGIYYNGNVSEVNQVKYHFIKNIRETDTLFYEKRYQTNSLIIKKPYFEFVVSSYFDRALIKEAGAKYFTKIEPIK